MLYRFLEPDQIYHDPGVSIIEEIWYSGVTFRAGYSYQGKQGLLIRAGGNIIYYDEGFIFGPDLSLGYSF